MAVLNVFDWYVSLASYINFTRGKMRWDGAVLLAALCVVRPKVSKQNIYLLKRKGFKNFPTVGASFTEQMGRLRCVIY